MLQEWIVFPLGGRLGRRVPPEGYFKVHRAQKIRWVTLQEGGGLVLKNWEHLEVREQLTRRPQLRYIYIQIYIQIPDDLSIYCVSGFELAFEFSSLPQPLSVSHALDSFHDLTISSHISFSEYVLHFTRTFMCLCIHNVVPSGVQRVVGPGSYWIAAILHLLGSLQIT